MKRHLLFVLIGVLLSACQTTSPTAIPTQEVQTTTQTPSIATAPPTATRLMTNTPTALPPATATPTPSATPTTAASPTPIETLTSTASPTPAPTSLPTATPTTSTPAAPAKRDVIVNSDNGLNLRAEADATATVLRTLSPGTHLIALGAPRTAGGISWQNVQTDDGQLGWVAAQYVIDQAQATPVPTATPAAPTPSTTPVVTPIAASGYVYVAAPDGLNLRASASASSQLLRTLANGQRLATNGLGLGPDDNGITWFNVKTDDNVEGWVAYQFVTTTVPSVAPAPQPVNSLEAVQEILRRTNALRQSNNVPPVTLLSDLSQLALEHSQYMAQNGITHMGANGLSASQRIKQAGYGAGRPVENIYGGMASIDDAWDYWKTDPPHLDVLLNPYNTVVGIGVYKVGGMTYYTMDFGKPEE